MTGRFAEVEKEIQALALKIAAAVVDVPGDVAGWSVNTSGSRVNIMVRVQQPGATEFVTVTDSGTAEALAGAAKATFSSATGAAGCACKKPCA